MKKKMILLFALLLAIYSEAAPALALDINIAGKPYPAFLFIPLALILFIWLAIMFKWLFRHFSRIALFFYNVGKFVSAFGFRMGITRLKEKIKQKPLMEEPVEGKAIKEIPKEEATKDLTPFIEKINSLERKLEHSKDPDAIFRELTPVIKGFFKALLNIHYEFTDDEMVDVLEKKKKHLVEFANKISELKYSGKKLSPKEIHELVKEFKSIVHKYVETGWKPKRIAKGVIERLAEQDKKIFDNVKQYVGFLGGESRKLQIESLLEDEQEILKRNIGSMKRTYNKILRMYVQLSPNEKAAVYPQLVEFYKNANKAIFSSVYGEKSKKELEYFVKELQRLKAMPKMQPWAAKLRMFFSSAVSRKPRKQEDKKSIPEVKLKGKKLEEKAQPLSMKPLFKKLTKIFRPEGMPEKKAKKMLAVKEPKLKEPSLKPFIERLQEFKDSARKLFSKIPTKPMKVEKLVVPKPSKPAAPSFEKTNAIEQIGKMLEQTPAIEQVDYMKKVEKNISKAWNLIAVADFKAFENLYEKIKLDYVNLGENEKQVMDQRLTTLLDAETKAKGTIESRKEEEGLRQAEEQGRRIEEERIKAEQEGRQVEEVLQQGIRTRERETAQKEAREMVSEIQHELDEEEEIRKEEEILLRLEEERKQKERQAGIAKDQNELRKVLKKVDEEFKEKDEINREEEELLTWAERRKQRKERREAQRIKEELERQHQEQDELNKEEELLLRLEAERKQREAKAYTLKEKSKVRAELRQIDILFKERKRLELEQLERERKAEAQRKRLETLEKKKQQRVLTPELTKIDSIFKQKQQEELEEQRRREWEEQARTAEERKKTKLEEIAETRLKRDIEDQIKRDRLIRQREAEALKREEERRRIELDKRRHVSDRLRIEKEKEWKSSVHGKSLDSLEELQNQLRSVIINLERKPAAPSEGIKDRLEREAEVVRREVEAKRASDLKRITVKDELKKKKKALSPLEEEQLKLILELERISKGL